MSENKKQSDASKKGKVDCGAIETLTSCSPPVKNVTHPLRYYEFTRDEIKALEECDKESFYQRCIPYSALFATATYAAIRYGILKKNPHLGVFPKVLLAVLFGHFYGRYAYIPHCAEKLRTTLPCDSHLGNTMRNYYCEQFKKPGAK